MPTMESTRRPQWPWPFRHPLHRPQRLPAGDGAGALPRLLVVGDAGEQPPQLDRGRELAMLLEGGADRSGLSLTDDEHRWSMGRHVVAGKRSCRIFNGHRAPVPMAISGHLLSCCRPVTRSSQPMPPDRPTRVAAPVHWRR